MGSWVLRKTGISGFIEGVRERRERRRKQREERLERRRREQERWEANKKDFLRLFIAGAVVASMFWIIAIGAMVGAVQDFLELPKGFLKGLVTLL